MGNKGLRVTVVLLLAAGAIFWLLGGADLFSSGGGSPDREADGDDPALLEHGGQGDVQRAVDGTPPKGPVLFGRAKEQRVGVGGLMGRTMDFRSGEVVAAARVVVTGTGYGGETFQHQLTTDANGRFHFERVAAGEGYSLEVVGGGHQRSLAGVAIEADGLRDLGTIWLGERGALEGVVTDAAGGGVVGARVEVHRGGSLLDMLENIPDLMEQMDQDPVPLGQATTVEAGRFRIERLDPGPISVVVRAAGYQQKLVKAVMTDQGAAGGSLAVRLEESQPLTGIVVDERGRGVDGARVACMNQNDMDSAFYGRQFTGTDAEGRFRIDSPPTVDKVTVIVAAEGFPTLFTQVNAGSGDLRLVLRGGVEVVLRVLEAGTERAIEGARVMVMFGDDTSMGQSETSFVHGVTDDRGEAFLAARPGKLQMLFLNHAERGTGMFSPAMSVASGSSIIKGPKDPTVKAPRTTLVFHVDEGITLTGRVTDPEDNPIAGARCRVIGAMGFGATAATDADGRYALRGQSALIQLVIVKAPGYVQTFPGSGGFGMPRKPDARGEIVFDVVMQPAASVAGRVLGPGGQPLAGARVKTRGGGKDGGMGGAMLSDMLGGGGEGVTNATGRYVLDGVRPGKGVRVLARHAGHLDGKSAEFAVKVGEVNAAPDLALMRGATMTVHVSDPAGRAVAKARVEVSLAPHQDERVDWDPMSRWRNFADLRTGADGTVVIELLPRGQITVTATHDDYAGARKTAPVERLDGGEPKSSELRLRLREAFTLRGRVVDEEGRPVAKANVAAAAGAGASKAEDAWIPARSAAAGPDGRFEITGLPDEPMQVFATAEGFKRARVPVATPRAELEIELQRVSEDAQQRLTEIQKELMEIYQAFAAVKDDAERQALLQRMQALQKEQRDLQGEDGGR